MSAKPKGGSKMRKSAQVAEQVKKLRATLGGLTQDQLADRLGIGRAAVSQWESESREPTSEAYLRLGIEAMDPELRRWFWEQSGFDVERLLAAAAEELTPSEKAARYLRNLPDNAEVFTVSEEMAGPFPPGYVFIIEPAADPQAPEPFWGQVVLLDFPSRESRPSVAGSSSWPTGLFEGRLLCKAEFPVRGSYKDLTWGHPSATLIYVATVGPPNDSGGRFDWRDPTVHAVGWWSYPMPPEEPAEGSERETAQAELAAQRRKWKAVWDKEAQGGVVMRTPELKQEEAALSQAEMRLRALLSAEWQEAEEQARARAPKELRLYPAVRIVGRVIARFAAAPKEQK